MPEREYEEQPVAPDLAAVVDEQAEYSMAGPPGGDLLRRLRSTCCPPRR
jgi:hypothetical protein